MALYARGKGGTGQVVDTSIYESVWMMMEGVLPDYDGAGIVRGASGSTITGIVPSNTYKTKDSKSVVIGANSDTLFKRLMACMGRLDIGDSIEYDNNQKRVEHQQFLDSTIEKWTLSLNADDVIDKVTKAQVPNGLIYSIEDIAHDPQYIARGMIETVRVESLDRNLKIPGFSPKFSKTPGKTIWAGSELGEHSDHVFRDILKYDNEKIQTLIENGSILWPSSKPHFS